MEEFEALLARERGPVERFVRFRLPTQADADDVLQEVYLLAFQRFDQLRDRSAFRPWLLSIARNKCNDYFREKAISLEIPIDAISQSVLSYSRTGPRVNTAVRDTLELLGDKDKQILYLYFWKELPQAEIARRLDLPIGTVKSRLHTAKRNFKSKYPYFNKSTQGGKSMKKLPDILPDYTIEPMTEPPFPVRWEELMGWFIVPRLGEKLSWAMYDFPEKKRTELCAMEVTGKDILAESHTEDGVKKLFTFLDGDSFLDNWGFGEDNCGNEIHLAPKGDITKSGSAVTGKDKEFLLDVVGRYKVTMGGKVYTRSASSTSRPIMTAPSASSSWMKTAGPSSGGGSTGTTGP